MSKNKVYINSYKTILIELKKENKGIENRIMKRDYSPDHKIRDLEKEDREETMSINLDYLRNTLKLIPKACLNRFSASVGILSIKNRVNSDGEENTLLKIETEDLIIYIAGRQA